MRWLLSHFPFTNRPGYCLLQADEQLKKQIPSVPAGTERQLAPVKKQNESSQAKDPTEDPTEGPTEDPTEDPTEGPIEGPIEGPTEGPTQGAPEGPT